LFVFFVNKYTIPNFYLKGISTEVFKFGINYQ
jgi:hypothetical protein